MTSEKGRHDIGRIEFGPPGSAEQRLKRMIAASPEAHVCDHSKCEAEIARLRKGLADLDREIAEVAKDPITQGGERRMLAALRVKIAALKPGEADNG